MKVRSNVYLDKEIKKRAKSVFEKYSLSLSDAINIFLAQSVYSNGFPFKIEIPTKETEKAMKETEKGINLEETSLEELKKEAKSRTGDC
jgi:DNA-damage-inducible protein J